MGCNNSCSLCCFLRMNLDLAVNATANPCGACHAWASGLLPDRTNIPLKLGWLHELPVPCVEQHFVCWIYKNSELTKLVCFLTEHFSNDIQWFINKLYLLNVVSGSRFTSSLLFTTYSIWYKTKQFRYSSVIHWWAIYQWVWVFWSGWKLVHSELIIISIFTCCFPWFLQWCRSN